MGQLQVRPLSITQFVQRLETEEGFSFARYGDGTFLSLNGAEGWNCDGAEVSIRQANEIEASILDETIVHGMGDLALTVGNSEEWLTRKGIDIKWYDCNVMNRASHDGTLFPFVSWLRSRAIVQLGPKHHRKMKGFPVQHFIEVHPTLAFNQMEELQVLAEYAVERTGANTVLISAGPAAPPLVSRIHKTFPHLNVIDTGSIWDPYVGVLSRKSHKRMGQNKFRSLGKLNFREDIFKWLRT